MACRVLLLIVLLGVTAHLTEARCGRKSQNVKVDNCTGKVCTLPKGGNTGITIRFRPDKPYDRLKAKVTGVLGGIRVPFAGVPSDACSGLQQGACPVQPGQEYVYRADIPVSRAYPSISAKVEFLLVDAETDESVACSLIRVRIR
ncbi:NPC intracellular cholesterol transporter 2-like [Amphibalanus amphitrite]|uniref:NPC intracellular cholesterol transporter 2-like n=1 Tax=Amphibalanus amphitrite TaxID=1232801 RepID=UPI001C8FE880|nr:NPC intracellular cholesterol transporter 2-like [Amphibalanus amphitrite]